MPATPRLSVSGSGASQSLSVGSFTVKTSDLNPVGMVVSSMLTEAQFQAQNGTGWVLMDGRNVSGSAYATITGSTTVPDARGMILRGKNNGRSDGSQNPDGDSSLGAYQGDNFGSHRHNYGPDGGTDGTHNRQVVFNSSPTGGSGSSPIGFGQAFNGGGGSGHWMGIYNSGGNETRMRNITVNHFIKIN